MEFGIGLAIRSAWGFNTSKVRYFGNMRMPTTFYNEITHPKSSNRIWQNYFLNTDFTGVELTKNVDETIGGSGGGASYFAYAG